MSAPTVRSDGSLHRSATNRPTATTLLFYLAIPSLGGATLHALMKNLGSLQAHGDLLALAIGIAVAFVTAAAIIRWMLRYVAHCGSRVFAAYRVVVGLLVLLVLWR